MSHGNLSSNRVVNDLGKRLLEAARHGNTEEVNNLMSNGAPLTTDWLGTTPLHLAAIYGHTSTAEVLIKSGISRDGRTKVDKAPLHFACQHGHSDIVKLLVSGGAHVNAADMLKMTPLHWAVEANNFDICLILLKAGVKTGLKNKFDKTPLRIARDKAFHSIVQLLCDEKFKVLQDIDVLHQNNLRDRNISSVKICRPENFGNTMLKKPKTRRFPMVAGTWTGGEAQSQDRIEMNERKKLGIFKRRPAPLPTDGITPFLGSLHLSPPTPAMDGGSSQQDQRTIPTLTTATHGSPLQQLVETVRQSTYLGNKDLEKSASNKFATTTTITTTSATFIPLPQTNKQTSTITELVNSNNHNVLHSRIPVISSLALKSLPPNIQAIPLSITADDLRRNNLLDTSCSFSPIIESPSIILPKHSAVPNTLHVNNIKTESTLSDIIAVTTPYNNDSNTKGLVTKSTAHETVEPPNMTSKLSISCTPTPPLLPPPPPIQAQENSSQTTIPVNIPVHLLNQIMNGDITLHSLPNKSKDPKNLLQILAGINTEMGTIPIIPVTGEGGLQLIPVENSDTSLTTHDEREIHKKDSTISIEKPQPFRSPLQVHSAGVQFPGLSPHRPPVFVQNQPIGPYSYPYEAHQHTHAAYDVGNGILQAKPASAATTLTVAGGGMHTNPHTQVPTPMLLPTGIYLQAGHPGFLQLHRQPTPYSSVSSPQNFMMPSLYPSYGHGHGPPTVVPPQLQPPMMQHGQQILMHPSGQPAFLPQVQPQYVYLEGHNGNKGLTAPESPQEPDSST